ncbi:Hypothetical protein, putative [Bodo saltans]|uniref:Uncharacterized protein n=1 Tax=Bodo saltans TaxID=75058 RepID=A0A0S4JK97_BODSA|nr:Hypothetical protein, putative [Bodo saltans]|eukprot:CUG90546.1 Hypothetical protein, putative [Bodo saltans]
MLMGLEWLTEGVCASSSSAAMRNRSERSDTTFLCSGLGVCALSSFHKSPSPAPETTESQKVVVDELYSARNGTCGGQSAAGFHTGFHGAFAE